MLKPINLNDLEEKLPTFDELLGDLSDQELKDFSSLVEEVHLPAGAVLFSEGTTSDNLYIIDDGQLAIFQNNPATGRPVEIARVGKGNIVGEMAFLVENSHTATARAIVDSRVYRISKTAYAGMEKKNLTLCYKFIMAVIRVLSHRLKKRNLQVARTTH